MNRPRLKLKDWLQNYTPLFLRQVIKLMSVAISRNRTLRLFLFYIACANVCIILISAFLNNWQKIWYDSLAAKNFSNIVYLLLSYGLVLLGRIVISNEVGPLQSKMCYIIRFALYDNFGSKVLNDNNCEVSCQRMTVDLGQFARLALNLLVSAFYCIIKLPLFLFILFKSVGFGLPFATLCYALVGSYLSRYISKPIVMLDYENETAEGHLRRSVIDQVKSEFKILPDVARVMNSAIALINAEKKLSYFVDFYMSISQFLPWFILLPQYTSGQISLGSMVQAIAAYDVVMTMMAFFTTQRETIVTLRATVLRLKELEPAK